MATNNPNDEDRCRVVTEVAIQEAMDACGSEEAVREQLQRIVGLNADPEGLDIDCDTALANGLDMKTLTSTRATRQWVFCRAWNMVEEEGRTLSDAVEAAWAEAQAAGVDKNIEV